MYITNAINFLSLMSQRYLIHFPACSNTNFTMLSKVPIEKQSFCTADLPNGRIVGTCKKSIFIISNAVDIFHAFLTFPIVSRSSYSSFVFFSIITSFLRTLLAENYFPDCMLFEYSKNAGTVNEIDVFQRPQDPVQVKKDAQDQGCPLYVFLPPSIVSKC